MLMGGLKDWNIRRCYCVVLNNYNPVLSLVCMHVKHLKILWIGRQIDCLQVDELIEDTFTYM